jgi:hypothetical protein
MKEVSIFAFYAQPGNWLQTKGLYRESALAARPENNQDLTKRSWFRIPRRPHCRAPDFPIKPINSFDWTEISRRDSLLTELRHLFGTESPFWSVRADSKILSLKFPVLSAVVTADCSWSFAGWLWFALVAGGRSWETGF